ncbi:unnamed protein product [Heterotrigona itama]|uniref:Uncharacterized protein n=1 Tax=Heterotrigona itama TaxID=395501 RepID=A0A6V7GU87_9HYME|nr:unnamed protein product [Heterotrigona itama]
MKIIFIFTKLCSTTSRKVGMQPSHFAISTNFLVKQQSAEAKLKDGLRSSNLADEKGSGQPSNFDDQALLAAVEEDEILTTRMLAEDFNVDHSTIVRRLKKLGKVWKLAGWVPHEF